MKIHPRLIKDGGNMDDDISDRDKRQRNRALHVNHVVESQNTVGFQNSIDTLRHPVCPLGDAHRISSCQRVFSLWFFIFVGCIGYKDETKAFDCFHKSWDNILQPVRNDC